MEPKTKAPRKQTISREKADGLLQDVIDQANSFVQQYPWWPIRLNRIAVLGSYLTDVERLGELSIAIDAEKVMGSDFEQQLQRARECAINAGFKPRNKFEMVVMPNLFLYNWLRNRKKFVSLYEWEDFEAHNYPHRVVWTATRDT